MRKVLGRKFFDRKAQAVAEALLGKYLVRRIGAKTIALPIREVEVYDGPADRGSHASRGKTRRNAVMFAPAGRWYVYFTYGMHWLANIVVGPEHYPAAVLIRAAGDVVGPARVTKFFKIDGRLNGKAATRRDGLWIENRDLRIAPSQIKKGPRVGIDYAGRYWKRRRLRFWYNRPEWKIIITSRGYAGPPRSAGKRASERGYRKRR